jgi:hypothetical protein
MVWHDSVPASRVKILGLGQALGYGIKDVAAFGGRDVLTKVPDINV